MMAQGAVGGFARHNFPSAVKVLEVAHLESTRQEAGSQHVLQTNRSMAIVRLRLARHDQHAQRRPGLPRPVYPSCKRCSVHRVAAVANSSCRERRLLHRFHPDFRYRSFDRSAAKSFTRYPDSLAMARA